MEYLKSAAKSVAAAVPWNADTPQSQALNSRQVPNSAGGYTYKVNDLMRLRRFLVLGSEGGTYYISEKELGLSNAKCISKLIDEGKGEDVVNEVVTYSTEGRTPKQNPMIFVLAMCARQNKDIKVKKLAYEKLAEVCRIPTTLFMFINYCESLSQAGDLSVTGWGRAHRKAISEWYLRFADDPKRLALLVTKYKNRGGWQHRDVLRLAHPKAKSDGVAAVLRYVIKGLEEAEKEFLREDSDENVKKMFEFLKAVEDIKQCKQEDIEQVTSLIRKHQLVREHIPTEFLNSVDVWRELLQRMPMTAMIRNLGKMTKIGLLSPDSAEAKLVCAKLQNPEVLQAAKIHPFNVLVAYKTYEQGHGEKGKLKWTPNPAIKKALNLAFYKSFKFVEPTNKRYCLALDVSGSMHTPILGSAIGCNTAAAAMSMVTARTEKTYEVVGFSDNLTPIPITGDMPLDQVLTEVASIPMGSTDCGLPMTWAKKENKKFDVFIVYTDCETWCGHIHPDEALRQYRAHSGIRDAKLIVCGMASNGFTIADPEDPGMLDMAGFDSSAPAIIKDFVLGNI